MGLEVGLKSQKAAVEAMSTWIEAQTSKDSHFKKLGRLLFSAASLLAGILVAVLIQAVLSSIYDNF